MTIAWSQPCRRMIILMIIAGIVTGCAAVFQDLDDMMQRKTFKADYTALETALAIYDEGDFEKAFGQFKALKKFSDSETIARRAWLGEICCRLVLADTQAEYTTAIGMWHEYGGSGPDKNAIQDPALLDPLFLRLPIPQPPAVIENHTPVATASEDTPVTAEQKQEKVKQEDHQTQAEIADLKKKVERTAQLQRRLDRIVAENRTLKEKIKALEAIDQNIQKKKTEIAAPSE